MKITVLTLFPEMLEPIVHSSILKRAQEKGAFEIEFINFRDFGNDNYQTIDDKPYGGGTGMVLMVEPIVKALRSIQSSGKMHMVLTSARGITFNQAKAQEFSRLEHLVIIAGHYEGFDERISEYIDEEISIGDFVMTGGEIAAAAIIDSVVRLIPGVLKKEDATQQESFFYVQVDELRKIAGETPEITKLIQKGITEVQLLEYPHYTRPETFEEKKVPDMLLSGNHAEIYKWRIQKAWQETLKRRPDLLA